MTKAKKDLSASEITSMLSSRYGSTSTISHVKKPPFEVRLVLWAVLLRHRVSLSLRQWFLPATVCTCTGLYPMRCRSETGYHLQKHSSACVRNTDCLPTMHARLTHLGCCDLWEHIIGKMQATPSPWCGWGDQEPATTAQNSFHGLGISQMWVDEAASALAKSIDQQLFQSILNAQYRSLVDNARQANTPVVQVANPKFEVKPYASAVCSDISLKPGGVIKANPNGVLPSLYWRT